MIALLLVIICTTFALIQAPHPDAYRESGFWYKIFYPIEQNAFQRLGYIDTFLNGIYLFPDNEDFTIWVVGNGGIILKTRNWGKTWEKKNSGTENDLNLIFFSPDGKKGWAVGSGGLIVKSTNGGESWRRKESGTKKELMSVYFLMNNLIGWAFGEGMVLKTKDGGESWEESEIKLPPIQFAPGTKFTEVGMNLFLNNLVLYDRDQKNTVFKQSGSIIQSKTNSIPGDRRIVIPPISKFERIFFSNDRKTGWAISGSAILKTIDGGKKWKQIEKKENSIPKKIQFPLLDFPDRKFNFKAELVPKSIKKTGNIQGGKDLIFYKPTFFINYDDTGLAVNTSGKVIKTIDSGRSWNNISKKSFFDLHLFKGQKIGWLVGERGTVLRTTDGGYCWDRVEIGTKEYFVSVYFVDRNNGWIVGAFGTILRTSNGGKSWEGVDGEPKNNFSSVYFFDSSNGWIVGDSGIVFMTTDGGKSWKKVDVGHNVHLRSVYFMSLKRGWIVGAFGTLLKTIDGGKSWEKLEVGTNEFFHSVCFANYDIGWIVGDNGIVLKTTDGGNTWLKKTIGVSMDLHSVKFVEDDKIGWLLGEDGSIFHTKDGGDSWTLINKYRRYPGGWYYISLVLAAFFMFQAFRDTDQRVKSRHAIEELLISDKPLESGEPDFLNFSPLARGISRFIRNRNTKPPLTIAVTGEWGMGKSSLMNLVKHDLQKNRFYPVWFNAWHHQNEEQLLASLLENIRLQGIPPFWHIKGLRFRARLFAQRIRRFLPILFVVLLIYAAFAGFLISCGGDPGLVLSGRIVDLVKGWAFLGLLLNTAVLLIAFYRKLKPFGSGFNSIIRSISGSFTIRDLDKDTGFRYKFAREFKEVTRALYPYNLVILIDDLDRCKPTHVTQILESINFLVSSGDCVVIMGLALDRVQRCVGLEFKDVAEVVEPSYRKQVRKEGEEKANLLKFAREYLKKLVNIEVPVPKTTDEHIERILKQQGKMMTGEVELPGNIFTRFLAYLYNNRNSIRNVLLMILSVIGIAYVGYRVGESVEIKNPESVKNVTQKSVEKTSNDVQPKVFKKRPKEEEVKKKNIFNRGTRKVLEGQRDRFRLEYFLFLVLFLIIAFFYIFRKEEEDIVEDSPEFIEALGIWMPLIGIKHRTPREVKRFQNQVRYYAMRYQSDKKPKSMLERFLSKHGIIKYPDDIEEQIIPDEILVTLAAFHTYNSDYVEDDKLWQVLKKILNNNSLNEIDEPVIGNRHLFEDCFQRKKARGLFFKKIINEHRERFLQIVSHMKID